MDPPNKSSFGSADDPEFCCCSISKAFYWLDGEPTIQILICTLEIPACLITILANLLVIVSIWRTPSLHSPSNVLLVGLAFSDLSVSLVSQPAFTTGLIAKIAQKLSLFCAPFAVAWIAGYLLCAVSLLTLTAISLDRYIAVYFHLRYKEIVTFERVNATFVVIWVVSISHSLLYALSIPIAPLVTVISLTFSLSIIMLVSFLIYRVVCRHQRQIAAQIMQVHVRLRVRLINMVQFKKSFMNMQILCFALVICYFPSLVILGILLTEELTPSTQAAFEFSIFLVHLNSILNPFLYCWRYKPIREAVIKLIRDTFPR